MNELLVLVETVAGLTRVIGLTAFALAVGFLIFDRHAIPAEGASRPGLRDAA